MQRLLCSAMVCLCFITKMPARKMDFNVYDTNGDGAITMSEVAHATAMKNQFLSLDNDADGELTQDEYEKFSI